MKNILTLLFILLFGTSGFTTYAQDFTIELSASRLSIKPGETKRVELKLNRSKGNLKSKAKFGFSSPVPQGITLEYETSEGIANSTTLIVSVAEDVKEDSYVIVPNCSLNNKSKGAILTLIVSTLNEPVSKGD